MPTVQYCIKVNLPDGSAVDGAQIEARNKNAWQEHGRHWDGMTKDGEYCWEHLDRGANGDAYDFKIRYLDDRGIEWRGSFTDRVFSDSTKEIILRPLFLDEEMNFSIPADVEMYFSKTDAGKEIIAAIRELSSAIKNGLSRSALTLSTYILEGMIYLKATELGIWKKAYGEKAFGGLLSINEIRDMFPDGALDKAEGLNKLRIPGAHFKGISSVIEESRIATNIILFLAKTWFKNVIKKDTPTEESTKTD